jgi:hypothetical protein
MAKQLLAYFYYLDDSLINPAFMTIRVRMQI